MSGTPQGTGLSWRSIILLQIGLLLSLVAMLGAVDGPARLIVWAVAALIEVGLVVEAVRVARRPESRG